METIFANREYKDGTTLYFKVENTSIYVREPESSQYTYTNCYIDHFGAVYKKVLGSYVGEFKAKNIEEFMDNYMKL